MMKVAFLAVFGLVSAGWSVDVVSSAFTPNSHSHSHSHSRSGRSCRSPWQPSSSSSCLFYTGSISPEEALKRTQNHLKRLGRQSKAREAATENEELKTLCQEYLLQSANVLKEKLKERRLPTKGRKPDLAQRLAMSDLKLEQELTDQQHGLDADQQAGISPWKSSLDDETTASSVGSGFFCGLSLSPAATHALSRANFLETPSPIQQAAIPRIATGVDGSSPQESIILHASTGTGKTLAYLLAITERLWDRVEQDIDDDNEPEFGIILTPTRELATQVASVATVLAPPGSVRMVSHPTNLISDMTKDRGEEINGGRLEDPTIGRYNKRPTLFVGSAKAIQYSLFGDGGDKYPASPTRKPQAMHILQHTRWLVLDEVDKLLNVVGKKKQSPSSKRHEKPAAILAASVARFTLGRAQVIAASATVGRPLKRELTRVLGLSPQQCPAVVRGSDMAMDEEDDDDYADNNSRQPRQTQGDGGFAGVHVSRSVTIPDTVTNYVTAVDTSSVGKLMTSAFDVIKALNQNKKGRRRRRRMLLVLTRGCGLKTQTAIGALKHFKCQPEPMSLLDALEAKEGGTDRLMERHRQVSGAIGIGESSSSFSSSAAASSYFNNDKVSSAGEEDDEEDEDDGGEGYLLVTGEDTIRGLHLDGLDVVIVVGRAHGPDEYTHIAGRTGRAGNKGFVINVLSEEHAVAVKGWERMLNVDFERLAMEDVERLE